MAAPVRASPPSHREHILSALSTNSAHLAGPVLRTVADNAAPTSVFLDGPRSALPDTALVHSRSGGTTGHERANKQYAYYPASAPPAKNGGGGGGGGGGAGDSNRRFLSRVICCAGRLHGCLRSFGLLKGEESNAELTQLLVCACASVAALLVLLLFAVGFLIVVFVVLLPDAQWQLRQTLAPSFDVDKGHTGIDGGAQRGTSPPSPFDLKRILAASGLKEFLQQAHYAEELRRRAVRNHTLLAAIRRARENGQAHEYGELASLVQSLPELERLAAQLLQVSVYVQAVQAHDPSLGLVELSDFLLNAKGRPAALERAAAAARREAAAAAGAAAGGGGAAAAGGAMVAAAAEWGAALKECLAGRGETARVRAQLRGFVGVAAAEAERLARRPFDDVAMLQYRHAWTRSEVVPRLARVAGGGGHGGGAAVRAYDVASRAAEKADVYEAASVLNHVHYYPLRRYAAMRAYAAETVADADAWYSEVAGGVQARFGAVVAARAGGDGAAATATAAAAAAVRASPLSVLSVPYASAAREAEAAHLLTAADVEWMPEGLRAGAAVNTLTLFVSLASYRDAECPPTLLDLFRVARNPHRVYVGLAQQNRAGDTPCLLPEMYGALLCPSSGGDAVDAYAAAREAEARRRSLRGGVGADLRARHPGSGIALFDERVCFLSDHVRVRDIDSRQAKGPTYGRYMAMLLYRGEDLTMVLDSHNKFRPMWDTLGASMLAAYKEPKAALSHYPESYTPGAKDFDLYKTSTAYLCKAFFMKSFGYPRLNGIVIGSPGDFVDNNKYNDAYAYQKFSTITKAQNFRLPQPWVAGGFLFSNASIYRDVPFDPHLPYVFDGEEVLYSVRLWTHGYNIYSPPRGLCYHIYGRAKAPKVWSESAVWYRTQDRVRPRIHFFLQSHRKKDTKLLVPADTTNAYVVVDSSRYGMGRQRTVGQWYDYAGADPVNYTLDGRWCGVDETQMLVL